MTSAYYLRFESINQSINQSISFLPRVTIYTHAEVVLVHHEWLLSDVIYNIYLEESKGYLLFHRTCHSHIPRGWIRTTQYRSCENKLRGCIEINVAHLSNKSCREGLDASDFQEKTMRSKIKVKRNGGIKCPLIPR